MGMNWKALESYKCPIPGCGEPLKESKDGTKHLCTKCPFKISDEKITNMVVMRHIPLEPPEFIKEMRARESKTGFFSKWKWWNNLK